MNEPMITLRQDGGQARRQFVTESRKPVETSERRAAWHEGLRVAPSGSASG